MVSGSDDLSILVWDKQTTQLLEELKGHDAQVCCLHFYLKNFTIVDFLYPLTSYSALPYYILKWFVCVKKMQYVFAKNFLFS